MLRRHPLFLHRVFLSMGAKIPSGLGRENTMDLQKEITIREVTVDDLPRIHEIAVAGWQPIFGRSRLIVGDEMWNDLWSGWDERWFLYTPDTWDG